MARSAEIRSARSLPSANSLIRPAARLAGALTIIIVCDHAHISGGLAQVAHTSANALRRRGHRVIFFAAMSPVDPALLESDVEVVCLDQNDMLSDPSRLRAAGRALWNVVARRRLAELLGNVDERRAIVHFHGWSKALSPSVLWACRNLGVSTVHTLHDYVALCPNGALFNYVKAENCQLRPMSPACILSNCDARHYGHKLWRIARHAALLASGGGPGGKDIIYISEPQRRILAPLLPAGTSLHYVANPVDLHDLGPAEPASNEAFVFVGRLSVEKGAMLFVEAAGRSGVSAMFVGDGPLRQAIVAGGDRIPITGWVPTGEVVRHIRGARALVFPSLWYETFGLSVHEALANGVPAIVSDNTTSAEAIEHGRNGLVFRSGDVADLIAQIDILKDPNVAARLGKSAYERYWTDPPTLERHIERLEEVYRLVLARSTVRSSISTGSSPENVQ